eukprot:7190529-Prymnesium_polylepis.2
MLAVDRVGRRTLLLFGSAFTAAALALSAAAVSAGSAPLAVAAIGLTVVFYAGGERAFVPCVRTCGGRRAGCATASCG